MTHESLLNRSIEDIRTDIQKSIKSFDNECSKDEEVLKQVFSQHDNLRYEDILIKVIILNQLYSAGLNNNESSRSDRRNKKTMDIRKMAELITSFNISRGVIPIEAYHNQAFLYKVIDDFCKFVPSDYKLPLSFISKFYSWTCIANSNIEVDVPVVDKYVRGMIYYLGKNRYIKSQVGSITQTSLMKDYKSFRHSYFIIKNAVDESNLTCKEFDKYLWQFGKANSIWI